MTVAWGVVPVPTIAFRWTIALVVRRGTMIAAAAVRTMDPEEDPRPRDRTEEEVVTTTIGTVVAVGGDAVRRHPRAAAVAVARVLHRGTGAVAVHPRDAALIITTATTTTTTTTIAVGTVVRVAVRVRRRGEDPVRSRNGNFTVVIVIVGTVVRRSNQEGGVCVAWHGFSRRKQ